MSLKILRILHRHKLSLRIIPRKPVLLEIVFLMKKIFFCIAKKLQSHDFLIANVRASYYLNQTDKCPQECT